MRDWQSTLDNAVAGVRNVSSNSRNMDGTYNQTQMQDVLAKLDELILALRR